MTVAGSDSGAGAGIQADLKTFSALGVFGTTVVTAVTAQNTTEVLAVHPLDPALVELQMEALLQDLPVRAVKTGLLADESIVATVGSRAAAGELPNLVVDPVLVSSTHRRLLDESAVDAYLELLLPHARLVTPNIAEAAVLCGWPAERISGVEDMLEAAEVLAGRGARGVLVKGGHLRDGSSPDVLLEVGEHGEHLVEVLDATRVASSNDHGTGCTLSAAVAGHLARGLTVAEATAAAKRYVTAALRGAAHWTLGAGHGPLDHFGWATLPPRDAG